MTEVEYLETVCNAFAGGVRQLPLNWHRLPPAARLAHAKALHAELLASTDPAAQRFRQSNRRLFPPPPPVPTTSPAMLIRPAYVPPDVTEPPPPPALVQSATPPKASFPLLVNCDLHGAGDAVVMAWIAEGSKGSATECRLHATGQKRELLEAFCQAVEPSDEDSTNTFAAYAVEQKTHGGGSRVIQRGQCLGIQTTPKRPPYKLNHADKAWADSLGDRPTLVFPNVDDGTREWPPFYWLELYEALESAGMNPHFIGRDRDSRYHHVAHYHADRRWGELMHAMLAARAVIGNDSGPMHVAGTLGVLTFALLGPTTATMCNHMPSVIPLSAKAEEIDCVGCWYHRPYNSTCKIGCAALSHLLPEQVFAAVKERAGNGTR